MADEHIWAVLEDYTLKNNIQKRPSRYIGGVGLTGLESMVLQTLDYLVDLAVDVVNSELTVEMIENQFTFSFYSKQGCRISNGLEESFTSPYLFLAIINALSIQCGFGIEKDGERIIHIYHQGTLLEKALIPSEKKDQKIELAFTPDEKLFNKQSISYFILFNRCQELAMLNSGLTIQLTDGGQQKNFFKYDEGLVEYIFQKDASITRGSVPLMFNTVTADVAIQAVISKNGSTKIKDSFVNGHLPADGGTHLDGFIQGTVEAINQYLENTHRLQYLTVENFSERFDFVLSIKVKRPRYQGAVKKKIRNPELYKILKESAFQEVSKFLGMHPHWYSN